MGNLERTIKRNKVRYSILLRNKNIIDNGENNKLWKKPSKMLHNIWYNQSLQNLNYPSLTAANIAAAVQFLTALVGAEYEYKDLDSLAAFIATIPCNTTHRIKVSFSAKDVEHRFPILTVIAPDVEYPFTV